MAGNVVDSSNVPDAGESAEMIGDQSKDVVNKPEEIIQDHVQSSVDEQEEMAIDIIDSSNVQDVPESTEIISDQSKDDLDKPEAVIKDSVQISVDKQEVCSETSLSAEMTSSTVDSSTNQNASGSEEMIIDQSKDPLDKPDSVNRNLCQVTVGEEEMKRRISSFIFWKRKEIDRRNVLEFCDRPYIEEDDPEYGKVDTCARIDAIHFSRCGGKSRVKVSKVENKWGPQTRPMIDAKKIKKEPGTDVIEQAGNSLDMTEERLKNVSKADNKWGTQARPMIDVKKIKKEPGTEEVEQGDCLEIIEERLQNMESHLKIKTDSSLRHSIFQRLKNLEDRILFLEGISPEYFHFSGPKDSSPKKKTDSEKDKLYSNWSVDDLQKRIKHLQKSLKSKSVQSKKDKKD
ncbi:MAP3K12-binding inhibitory protein 1-like isoform X2 [Uloborus diversus]|uniref:MAP3K12-binding inhibitory protein 1-like isoform X2 n=1 Tax=Uloborus diversus TaxID=327109 RepID=UPI002409962F|nr:MAP3K12-binding inhibitory protein 1-like isoform X2 [Uloborus diversus]